MSAAKWLVLNMALAAVTPLLATRAGSPSNAMGAVPAWPHEFEGEPLHEVQMSADQRRLLEEFPGAVAQFTDGRRDIIMRWVTEPTRRLHPAEDCYRAWGYVIAPARIRPDRDGSRWRCFIATRDGQKREICEQIRDSEGGFFSDVSAWYWSATLERSRAPWLVVTVASPPR